MEENKKMIVNVNSIKSLYITVYYNETKLSTATGFIIQNEDQLYLITNRHVVTGRNNQTNQCLDKWGAIPNKLKVWIPYIKEDEYIWKNIEIDLYDGEEKPIWKEHRELREKVDVVAIYLGHNIINSFVYNLDNEYNPTVTEQMYIVGYPYGFDVRPQDGKYAIWSSARAASDPDLDLNIQGNQLPVFLVDAKTRAGQSGSPVIYYNEYGKIRKDNEVSIDGKPITKGIGIYSGRINSESDLGYVWKWSLLKKIIL